MASTRRKRAQVAEVMPRPTSVAPTAVSVLSTATGARLDLIGSVPADVEVAIPIWTTTPWTLPASLAISLGPELEYALVEGPARDGRRRWLVLADALAELALQRYGVAGVNVHGRAKGAALENLLFAHPFYDEREIPAILGGHVSDDCHLLLPIVK